jgi:hypothetical protein
MLLKLLKNNNIIINILIFIIILVYIVFYNYSIIQILNIYLIYI